MLLHHLNMAGAVSLNGIPIWRETACGWPAPPTCSPTAPPGAELQLQSRPDQTQLALRMPLAAAS